MYEDVKALFQVELKRYCVNDLEKCTEKEFDDVLFNAGDSLRLDVDLGIDSSGIVEFLIRAEGVIEDELGIELDLDPEYFMDTKNVGEAWARIEQQIRENNRSD